jgi:ubiquinone biosynthesis protein UbiJ
MAIQSPLQIVEGFARQIFARIPPPPWAVEEAQRRIVLLLNHVLMQEKAATERLARQKGRVLLFQWVPFSMAFLVTPAGLLDLAITGAGPDLTLTLSDPSAGSIAKTLVRGERPPVRIEGDVQLAADVNWLVDNVRWDLEEDLARVIGDAPAHNLAGIAAGLADAVRKFAGGGPAPSATPPGTAT